MLFIILVASSLVFAFYLYSFLYFKSKKFINIKNNIDIYIQYWNNLNKHINELKLNHFGTDQLQHGTAIFEDYSSWNYKRKELKNIRYAPNICHCSRTVCSAASKHPFKYICKYFNISPSTDSLEKVEEMLNDFEAVEDGKKRLQAIKHGIYNNIRKDIPFLIYKFRKSILSKKLGFEHADFQEAYYPLYIFKYTSPGGNASTQCNIVLNITNLNKFVIYLADIIKFKKSIAGQRSLMTSQLRHSIIERDRYTCKTCGNSTAIEPNLLLEVDHIIPVSKGGLTEESNLQTLCWRCNRKKGSKIT